ncbi:MAG TPA: hypothetical protein DDZ65_12855 [Firmicutes bacterium]|nr:hypothetical protein [Bacillota bacterium]
MQEKEEVGGIICLEGVDPVARYYVELEGYRYGPFELQELKQLYQDGVLKSDQIYEEQSNQLYSLTRLLAEYSVAGQRSAEPEHNVEARHNAVVQTEAGPFGSSGAQDGLTETASNDGGSVGSALGVAAAQEVAATQEAAAVQEVPESSPSESWSEKLARLKGTQNRQTGGAAESPVFLERSDSPVEDFNRFDKIEAESTAADLTLDVATRELREEMVADLDALPPVATNEELPDLLVSSDSHPEELINYNTSIQDDHGNPDLTIKLVDLSANEATAVDDADASSFPTGLGYMKEALDLEPPMEWLSNGPTPVAPTPTVPAAAAASAVPARQESNTDSEQAPAPHQGERLATEASAWREQMARLDVVYGVRESTGSKDLQAFGQDPSAADMSAQMGRENSVLGIDGEFGDSGEEHNGKSGGKLDSLLFIAAGLMALLARSEYALLNEMPALVVTATLCGYALLTAICGVMLWIDSKRYVRALRIVLLVLLPAPIAILGYTLFVYQDTVMAMQIPETLQQPLAYLAASLIIHAIGLVISKKAVQNVENA